MKLHESTTIIVGPPGTGKTTELINRIDVCLDMMKIDPERICFLSFTRKAAIEAKERSLKKFTQLKDKDLKFFRTIHSLAYYQLNVSRSQVMTKEHYVELGKILGVELSGNMVINDDMYGMSTGDRYFFIENLSRITYRPLKEVWEELADEELDWWELERIARGLKQYKENRLLLDYTDMLHKLITQGQFPTFDVLFVDEAQDLSPIQWDIIRMIAAKTKIAVYIAGDDDQAIYKWAGADVNQFINLEGKRIILKQSYRIPSSIHEVAVSIASRIDNRINKTFEPKKEPGLVRYHFGLDEIDMSKGEWLLLARNGYLLKQLEDHCMLSGFSFDSVFRSPLKSPALKAIKAWENIRKGNPFTDSDIDLIKRYSTIYNLYIDVISPGKVVLRENKADYPIWHKALDKISYREREYFISALRRGETLVGTPRIKISTIHGVKGGEADNVIIMTDMSYKTHLEMQRDEDNEHRVFYVAATRARQNLHIIMPRSNMAYSI